MSGAGHWNVHGYPHADWLQEGKAATLAAVITAYWAALGMNPTVWVAKEGGVFVIRSSMFNGLPRPKP